MINILPLGFNVQILQWLNFWPKEDKVTFLYALKNLAFNSHVYLAGYTVAMASIRQLVIGVDDASALVESSIGCIDFLGFAYMNCCFFNNITTIKYVFKAVNDFRRFCPEDLVVLTERKVKKYSKTIFAYSFLGNTINAILALYGASINCTRSNPLLYQRDPCGMPCRCFFPMDISGFPLFEFMFILQTYTCFIISFGVLAVTMFIIGVLMHTIAQLQYCAKIITEFTLENSQSSVVIKHALKDVIKYHITIIRYSEKTNSAFSSMMLFHLTVTSLIISVLCFNILIVDNITDCLRFGLHLGGWLVLLFLICYYGQQLIDESTKVGSAAYSVRWFNAPVSIQKDLQLIIARSQRPLTLTALNLGIMSFETFLKVIKAAYSYFALFLNLKS